MQTNERPIIDPARPRAEQIAELRAAVEACYCGFGPACHLWRQMDEAHRAECSLDMRAQVQRMWRTGM